MKGDAMDRIKAMIENLQPSEQSVELFRRLRIVLLVGITGAGKNTILSRLISAGKYSEIITSTTRPPRYNGGVLEQDGVDYHFLTAEQAIEKLERGEYVEASLVHGTLIYGVTSTEIARLASKDDIVIGDVDIQGVSKYRKLSNKVSAVFLLPPSYEEWRERIKVRYASPADFEADWPIRRQSAIKELEEALAKPYYHFVINDNLDEAVLACEKIIDSNETFHRKDDEMRLTAREILEELKTNN